MELLALATLHEFQNSLVFQSVFLSLSEGVWKNEEVKSKFPHKEKIFHHFYIKVFFPSHPPNNRVKMGVKAKKVKLCDFLLVYTHLLCWATPQQLPSSVFFRASWKIILKLFRFTLSQPPPLYRLLRVKIIISGKSFSFLSPPERAKENIKRNLNSNFRRLRPMKLPRIKLNLSRAWHIKFRFISPTFFFYFHVHFLCGKEESQLNSRELSTIWQHQKEKEVKRTF